MALNDSDLADAWSTSLRPDRVFYDTGVLLDAEDFRDEQTYHRGRLARARWPTWAARARWSGCASACSGLRPAGDQVGGGLAVDRLGRLIEVPRPGACALRPGWRRRATMRCAPRSGRRGVVADLYLRWVARGRGATPAFAHGAYDATDAIAPARVRDAFPLRPGAAAEAAADPAAPNFLPEARFAALRSVAAAERAAALREALRDGSNDALARPDGAALVPLREHGPGVDPASVFIARLRLPAVAGDARPDIDLDALADEHVDNHSRCFVLPNDLTAALLAA